MLQKAQPELKSLRQESATLKTTKEELAAKTTELRGLEKREKDLKAELSRAQRLASDRDAENQDTSRRKSRRRRTRDSGWRTRSAWPGRDLRRAEAEKIELSAKEEKATRELARIQEEASKLRPRIRELEDEAARLREAADVLKEESELKASQYTNAQNLLGSMRDQTAELSIQLRTRNPSARAWTKSSRRRARCSTNGPGGRDCAPPACRRRRACRLAGPRDAGPGWMRRSRSATDWRTGTRAPQRGGGEDAGRRRELRQGEDPRPGAGGQGSSASEKDEPRA